jgi:IgA Peptidase M64/Peptidase M64 N-terminus
MKRIFLIAFATVALATSVHAAPAAMRVDYYHTGNDKQEQFSLDRVVIEPLPWPGNVARSIDKTDRGKYFFEVIDAASGTMLYSRGFASVYGEWETTAEAQKMNRTFSESLRFPAVDKPARVSLKKRDAKNAWQEIWTFAIDPKDKFISKGLRTPAGPLIKLHEAGDPATKLDLLILGDGYTVAERPKFERDARKLMAVLFSTSPYKERHNDINVWGLSPGAAQSGVSRPSTGIYRRSPVGVSYDAFDTERYMLTFENRTFRDLAANAPYEVVEIITNSETYGGGGIFNQFSTAAANNLWAPYLFIHEFSHHLAALADEYYTSDVAYLPPAEKVEPWEPNVTALLDPANLKWKDLVTPGTPIPTPWPKEAFDHYVLGMQDRRRKIRADNRPEAEMDALFKEQMVHDFAVLNAPALKGIVGAFEGANYESRGYYRPQTDCIMFTRDAVGFCAVCRRAIEAILDLYSRP